MGVQCDSSRAETDPPQDVVAVGGVLGEWHDQGEHALRDVPEVDKGLVLVVGQELGVDQGNIELDVYPVLVLLDPLGYVLPPEDAQQLLLVVEVG